MLVRRRTLRTKSPLMGNATEWERSPLNKVRVPERSPLNKVRVPERSPKSKARVPEPSVARPLRAGSLMTGNPGGLTESLSTGRPVPAVRWGKGLLVPKKPKSLIPRALCD